MEKEIRWVGSAYDDLLAFPAEARQQAGRVRPALLPEENAGDEPEGQAHRRGSLSSYRQREERQVMKIDTEIRHVTKPGANLFLELGFSPEEAKRLQAASKKQINDTKLLKEQLMAELAAWIEQHHLKQAEAAEILMVSRPRVSDVVNRKTAKFTIDTLVEMLSRIGKPVRLAIGR